MIYLMFFKKIIYPHLFIFSFSLTLYLYVCLYIVPNWKKNQHTFNKNTIFIKNVKGIHYRWYYMYMSTIYFFPQNYRKECQEFLKQ